MASARLRSTLPGIGASPFVAAEAGNAALSASIYAAAVAKRDADEYREQQERAVVHERWEYAAMRDAPAVAGTGMQCEGDHLVQRIEAALAYLDTVGYERSKHQRVFHRAFLSTSYALLYGDTLHQHLVRLLEENGWSELRAECICVTPRRFGKTVGVALWAAVCLCVLRNHDISIYSNNQRASKMMLLMIYKIVKKLQDNPEFAGKIVSLNKSEQLNYITGEGYENIVYAYPAKAETLRGTGSRAKTGTVICEELAFMPLEVVYDIVCPTLTRRNVNFIGITTLQDTTSFAVGMMDAKFDNGSSVFLQVNFSLVCDPCREAGTPETCKHLLSDIPHWQSQSQHNKLEAIMRGSLDVYMRELKGFQMDANVQPAFLPAAVDALEQPGAMFSRTITVNHVFVAVDPACGGRHSKFAIVSAFYTGPAHEHMVVGWDGGGAGALRVSGGGVVLPNVYRQRSVSRKAAPSISRLA